MNTALKHVGQWKYKEESSTALMLLLVEWAKRRRTELYSWHAWIAFAIKLCNCRSERQNDRRSGVKFKGQFQKTVWFEECAENSCWPDTIITETRVHFTAWERGRNGVNLERVRGERSAIFNFPFTFIIWNTSLLLKDFYSIQLSILLSHSHNWDISGTTSRFAQMFMSVQGWTD